MDGWLLGSERRLSLSAIGDGIVEFAKQAKAIPQALLFTCGIHGGAYAKSFPAEYVSAAGLASTIAVVIGLFLLVFVAIKATIYPP